MKLIQNLLPWFALFSLNSLAQGQTLIDFEDQAMKQLLLQSHWRFEGVALDVDADQDGEISVAEAQAVETELILEHADLSDSALMSVVDLNQFTNVRELRLKGLWLKELGQLDLDKLDRLSFSKCKLEPFEQGSYPNLRFLTFVETPLSHLELEGLARLQSIGVVSAGLESLSVIGSPNLFAMWLDDNLLREVPPFFDRIYSLSISNNLLESLPEFPNTLRHLDVRGNRLTSIPDLSMMTTMRHLDVAQNQLAALPPLPDSLYWLHADHNQISQIDHLPANLQTAYLSHNALIEIPSLPAELYELDLSHNEFRAFQSPKGVNQLWSLDLSHNDLKVLPALADDLGSLVILKLANNQIGSVDVALPDRIEILDLSHNQIRTISVERPNGLDELQLGGNPLDLSSIDVKRWLNTRRLSLKGGIPEYPDFTDLLTIRHLDLSQNQLEALPELSRNLTGLSIDDNPITELPNLYQVTPNLFDFSANDCLLTALPVLPERLERLYVARNQLTSIRQVLPFKNRLGMIDLLEADFSGNLLEEDSCLMFSFFPDSEVFTFYPQQHGRTLDCEWIYQPIEVEDERLLSLLAEGTLLLAPFRSIDFNDPAELTPFNLARISFLELENLSALGMPLLEQAVTDHLISLKRAFLNGSPLADYHFLTNLTRLRFLDLSHHQLEWLPQLPDQIIQLSLHHNPLTEISSLPQRLGRLEANHTLLQSLPELPASLHHLEVQSGLLTTLPSLPERLVSLLISGNSIDQLPQLPPRLQNLYCHSMGLLELPELPDLLRILYAQHNALQTLPELPINMQTLALSYNQLTDLPEISVKNEVYLDHNQLTQAPQLLLPSKRVDVSHNPIMDWSAAADWRDLLNLDISHTGLISLEPFLSQEALLQVGEAALNLEGNLLTQADCDDIQTLIERYQPLIQYVQQQNESLSCIDTSATVAFADPYFEAFLLSYRLPSYDNIFLDRNNDGLIQVSEAASLKQLYIWDDASQITDLGGIEAFQNLEVVSLKGLPGLQALPDLGALTSLQSLEVPARLHQ